MSESANTRGTQSSGSLSPKVILSKLLEAVGQVTRYSRAQLQGTSREVSITRARALFVLSALERGFTKIQVAEGLRRERTSLTYLIERGDQLSDNDPQFLIDMSSVRRVMDGELVVDVKAEDLLKRIQRFREGLSAELDALSGLEARLREKR